MKLNLYKLDNFVKLLLVLINIGLIFQTDIFAQRGIGNVIVQDENGQKREVKLYDASYALVIGASNYDNGWRRLPGVKEDAAAVKEVLAKQGFEVEELSDPTSANFMPAINRFVNKYGWQPGNRLLIYFAGHGYTETAIDGRKFGYIVPVDAPNPQKDLASFQQQVVTMDDIENAARKIRSRHALFVFDSCFSGTLLNARRSNVPTYISNKVEKSVRQFISSGAEDQEVPDVSIFRRQFVAALNGEADRNADGFITGTELADFLQEKVTNYTRGSQTPQYGKIFDEALDKGDFVFAAPNKNAPTPAQIAWNNFREIAKKLLKYRSVEQFNEGFAEVSIGLNQHGLINKNGQEIIPPKYNILIFSEGLALTTIEVPWQNTVISKVGYINTEGLVVIPHKYNVAFTRPFSGGVAAIGEAYQTNNASRDLEFRCWYIDKNDRTVISPKYEQCTDFVNDVALVTRNSKTFLIDITGKELVQLNYDGFGISSKEGFRTVGSKEKYGFINDAGEEIIPLKYEAANNFSQGLAAVKSNESWGFIDKTGKLAIPFIYESVNSFSENLAAVELGGKYGFVNKTGKVVISPKYDWIGFFDSGFTQVELDKKFGLIDKTGKLLTPIKYENIWCYAFWKQGIIGVILNGKKGFVDIYGNEYFDF